jgi:hypothetical protein
VADEYDCRFDKRGKDNLKIQSDVVIALSPPVDGEDSESEGGDTGIPTVSDRIAQMVVKTRLEPAVDPLFHPIRGIDRESALEAVGPRRMLGI